MTEQRGFTLIELAITLALMAAMVTLTALLLLRPLDGAIAQQRRVALVDEGRLALQRIQRDIHSAVPNSVRVSADGLALELLHFSQVARYLPNRLGSPLPAFAAGTASQCLPAGNACDLIRLLDPAIEPAGVRWLVLYNIGAESAGAPLAGSNLWNPASPGVITPDGSSFALGAGAAAGESLLQVTPAGGSFRFAFASPRQRLYLADAVVGYRCSGGSLWRYELSSLNNSIAASLPAGAVQLASDVTACSLQYRRSAGSRIGLALLQLQLGRDGESIELLQQVHVDNVP